MNALRLIALVLVGLCFNSVARAHDTTFRVIGVSGQVLLEHRAPLPSDSLGKVSHTLLESALAQGQLHHYRGSENGVLSVNQLGSALEVLSDIHMKAYGWCYRVDGEVSDLLADEYKLNGVENEIEWFYAYANFEKNKWTAMCVPADHEPVQE